MRLQPFFCYYGGKWRAARRYPRPDYPTLIEPFAGGAGYALTYPECSVILYEVDPIVYGVWEYLTKVTPAEVLALPLEVEHVDELQVSEPAKWLIGFWLNKGSSTPKKSPSVWARGGSRPNSYWGEVVRARIAAQVRRIRHWKVHNRSYEAAGSLEATWFIDPPYAGEPGAHYRYRLTDYEALARWCQERPGQVIVCEQEGADWLPFRPFGVLAATRGEDRDGESSEVMWTNREPEAVDVLSLAFSDD